MNIQKMFLLKLVLCCIIHVSFREEQKQGCSRTVSEAGGDVTNLGEVSMPFVMSQRADLL